MIASTHTLLELEFGAFLYLMYISHILDREHFFGINDFQSNRWLKKTQMVSKLGNAYSKYGGMVGLPHTANVDFFIALLVRGIMNVEINFVGKKELFVFQLGYYFISIYT